MIHNSEKGVSLYLSLMIMTVLLTMALGLSAILFGQIRIVREMGNSVVAFYAADTGIEWTLYQSEECRRLSPDCNLSICKLDCTCLLDQTFPEKNIGQASYIATVSNNGATLKSIGRYKETKRAIEVSR